MPETMESQIEPVVAQIAEGLGSLGYSPTDSLVLTYFLLYPKDVTSQQVERATWLRQPQVSLSINSLLDKKWIRKSAQIPSGVGRAVITYDLVCAPDQMCDRLRDAVLNELDLKMRSVNKLENLLKDGASSNEAC